MRNKILFVVSAMAIAAVVGLTSTKLGVVSANPDYSTDDIRKQVSEMYPGEITELELEKEGDNLVYEIEVKQENKEIELKIDANTGEVLFSEIDYDDNDNDVVNSNGSSTNNTIISEEKAIEIALRQFNGAIEEIELDEDDSRLIYEIEMENGEKEAEIEIDAYTGKVLEVEIDD